MKNAVIYARFSSHSQTEQSIEGQLRVCHEYAEREGLRIVGEYIDRAISGRSDDRPDFQRMITDSKKKAFDYVLVYKLDRFARNRYDSAIYKHKLKQNNVKVLSAMENIGDNPESVILEAVLEASAEYYSIDLSQKIKRGRKETAAKGKYVGGMVPTGYKSVNGTLVIDEAKAPMMKYLFEQYAAGVPKTTILQELYDRGYRNRNGKPFNAAAFQSALKCEKYIGVMDQDGIRIEGGCPALIDKETFDKVQERLALNRRRGAKAKAKIEYMLSGKAWCGHCGKRMQGMSGRSATSTTHAYYSCAGRRGGNCKKNNEKKDFLEWYVVEQTLLYVLDPKRLRTIAKAVVDLYEKEFGKDQIDDLQKRVDRIDRELLKLTDSIIALPKSALPTIGQKMEQLELEKQELLIDISKLQIANGIHYTVEEIEAWLRNFCRGDLFDMEFRRRIIDVFINSVYVYDNRIVVFYNIKGGKLDIHLDPADIDDALSECDCSDIKGFVPPKTLKSEHTLFIFVNGLFGAVFLRE